MDINEIKQIFDCLIQEAENNPEWKAINALKCAKKEFLNLQKKIKSQKEKCDQFSEDGKPTCIA